LKAQVDGLIARTASFQKLGDLLGATKAADLRLEILLGLLLKRKMVLDEVKEIL
jgi:hypothetical protein